MLHLLLPVQAAGQGGQLSQPAVRPQQQPTNTFVTIAEQEQDPATAACRLLNTRMHRPHILQPNGHADKQQCVAPAPGSPSQHRCQHHLAARQVPVGRTQRARPPACYDWMRKSCPAWSPWTFATAHTRYSNSGAAVSALQNSLDACSFGSTHILFACPFLTCLVPGSLTYTIVRATPTSAAAGM